MEELEEILGLSQSGLELPTFSQTTDQFNSKNRNITILPTLHNEIIFSKTVHQLLDNSNFDQILVELPQELETELRTAIKRLPLTTVMHDGNLQHRDELTLTPDPQHAYIIHPGESLYWTVFLANRKKIPVRFIDQWHSDAKFDWGIPLNVYHIAAVGWHRFWEDGMNLLHRHIDNKIHLARSYFLAEQLETALTEAEDILIVCGAAHWPMLVAKLHQLGWNTTDSMIPHDVWEAYQSTDQPKWQRQKIPSWQYADIHPHTIHLVTNQLPYYLGRFIEDPQNYDQLELIRQLYFDAEKRYQEKFDELISPSAYRRMFQYLRNLGRIQGKLLPDLYNLILGAKGMVNDDYAFEVYRTAISYPFLPDETTKLDNQLKFVPDEKQGQVIRFAFKRRFKKPILKKIDDEYDDLDPIPDEEYPGQWQEIWDKYSPYGYVSYPPEDEFIEDYMQFLRKRIIEILQEEESSTIEFETSMEDGIDWRETMRHYHEGKIYVKKYPKNKYKVGALIIQFLEEPFDVSEYSHHSTLFAEHDQESHISVITTEPGDVIVGPGISRVKYAAIISQFPPVAMPYLISKQNIDLKLRLIWSAMQMSLGKIIGFVAKKPPTAAQRHFAAEHGYRLIYLPMGQLTSQSLRRLRTMHLLAHHELRDIAREYIGF